MELTKIAYKPPLKRINNWIKFFQCTGGYMREINEVGDGFIHLTYSKVFGSLSLGLVGLWLLSQTILPEILKRSGFTTDKIVEVGRNDGMKDTDVFSIFTSYGLDFVSVLALPILEYKMNAKFEAFVNKLAHVEQSLEMTSKYLSNISIDSNLIISRFARWPWCMRDSICVPHVFLERYGIDCHCFHAGSIRTGTDNDTGSYGDCFRCLVLQHFLRLRLSYLDEADDSVLSPLH